MTQRVAKNVLRKAGFGRPTRKFMVVRAVAVSRRALRTDRGKWNPQPVGMRQPRGVVIQLPRKLGEALASMFDDMAGRPDRYILDATGQPVPCRSLQEWGRWMSNKGANGGILEQTTVGEHWISTVFLGLDHSFGFEGGPPVLWETMVFDKDHRNGDEVRRYTSREAALQGHHDMVERYTPKPGEN